MQFSPRPGDDEHEGGEARSQESAGWRTPRDDRTSDSACEANLHQWCLAWKNVKAGTKYNKCLRSASLGKINEKGKTDKFRWVALYSNCVVEYSIKTVRFVPRCASALRLQHAGTERGRSNSGAQEVVPPREVQRRLGPKDACLRNTLAVHLGGYITTATTFIVLIHYRWKDRLLRLRES